MTTWIYNTILEGSVEQPFFPGSSGATFQRQGQLVISDDIIDPNGITNGVNLLEVGLSANDLPGNQSAIGLGSITFVTNNALFATRNSNDNVFEGVDSQSSTIVIQPDRSSSQHSINNFATGGFVSVPNQILDGLMVLRFDAQSVVGSINFSGTASSTYNATLTGELVSVT